jgi:biopolymer transport protein ExbD
MISAGDRSRYQVLAEVMTKAKNADVRKIGFDNTQR